MTPLHCFEKVADTGWCWNMFVVPLPGGGTLVHSPTFMGDDTFEKIEAHGAPKVLFAPNHYHYVHLTRFRARYPEARVVAPEGALPRLQKKGVAASPVKEVEPLLGKDIEVLRCDGLKSGEAWLRVGDAIVVSDAFFHVNRAVSGGMGLALRLTGTVPGLRIGRTFRWLGIGDRAAYRDWALQTIERITPRRLLVSHGEPVESAQLATTLTDLVARELS